MTDSERAATFYQRNMPDKWTGPPHPDDFLKALEELIVSVRQETFNEMRSFIDADIIRSLTDKWRPLAPEEKVSVNEFFLSREHQEPKKTICMVCGEDRALVPQAHVCEECRMGL